MNFKKPIKFETEFNKKKLIIETGRVARNADADVWLQYGKLVLLSIVSINHSKKSDSSYVPLSVTYLEKDYAKGLITGNYTKRETPQTIPQILYSRLIDRPIRPLFPSLYRNETVVDVILLSNDPTIPPDTMIITAASLALGLSSAPYTKQIAGIKICKTNDGLIVNPDYNNLKNSEFQIMVAGTKDAITMIECEANNADNSEIVESLNLAQKHINQLINIQEEFINKFSNIPKIQTLEDIENSAFFQGLIKLHNTQILEIANIVNLEKRKEEIDIFLKTLQLSFDTIHSKIADTAQYQQYDPNEILKSFKYTILRNCILNGYREDGRKTDELRQIECSVGLLPAADGSALFTRGDTQSLGIVTIGPERNDANFSDIDKSYFLHYNFPPFSVGDCQRKTSVSRREYGHGILAEKSLKAIMPYIKNFKRNIRIVSEILESNGSSSMASVCAASLALKNAGVPISALAAGISIGLISENNKNILISDIQGAEDHFGDMDFKIAGTRDGITGLQLDIKLNGINIEILAQALELAEINRLEILEKMEAIF